MKNHELKILPKYFQAVWSGLKEFELRKDDRGYQCGDILVLREWDGEKYTGSALCVKVTYILQDAEKYGLKDGYIIMGIRRIESNSDFKPITSADRIRAMTDEELAVWLEEFGGSSPNCNRGLSEYPDYKRCRDCWLDWLKQEVDDG